MTVSTEQVQPLRPHFGVRIPILRGVGDFFEDFFAPILSPIMQYVVSLALVIGQLVAFI